MTSCSINRLKSVNMLTRITEAVFQNIIANYPGLVSINGLKGLTKKL